MIEGSISFPSKPEESIKFNPTIYRADRPFQTSNRVREVVKLKTVAVLIGYQYHGHSIDGGRIRNDRDNPTVLPGILIDLYQAYTFAIKSSPTEIAVITDIEQDQIWKETVGAMGKHIVDSGILDFIATIRNKGIYNRYINKKWLEDKLAEIFDGADRVLFYYTGHGKGGYLEMPLSRTEEPQYPDPKQSSESGYMVTMLGETRPKSIRADPISEVQEGLPVTDLPLSQRRETTQSVRGGLISVNLPLSQRRETTQSVRGGLISINLPEFIKMDQIRKICFKQAKPNLEALFIFDSCNSTGLNMPFKLRPDGVFRLIDKIPRDVISYSSPKLSLYPTDQIIFPQVSGDYRIHKTKDVTTKWNSDEIESINQPNQLNPLETQFNNSETKTDSPPQISENHKTKGNTTDQCILKPPLINPKMMIKKRLFFKARAICISSTAPRQDSLSTTDGSLFTRYLFEAISSGEKSLHEIKKSLEIGCSSYSQTASIYSTYPDLIFLWKWLSGGEKTYRVYVDIHHGLVILTKVGGQD
uniref:Caspase n=1 Tax=Pithovirus LCPAC201 TaxID=2506591 RepID=A0A481Z5F9_9VIRU|nr:MAG: hypothetical protein LCPAC201_01170 [Pithovirus LCPAC201]